MDEHSGSASLPAECDPSRIESAAKAVQGDFQALLDLFEQQLAELPANDALRRFHLSEAKSAAARGVILSEQLLGMLRLSG
jgi:hypothetical protein